LRRLAYRSRQKKDYRGEAARGYSDASVYQPSENPIHQLRALLLPRVRLSEGVVLRCISVLPIPIARSPWPAWSDKSSVVAFWRFVFSNCAFLSWMLVALLATVPADGHSDDAQHFTATNLVVEANVEVIENRVQREREYILLLGYLSAEMRGKAPKDQVQRLRLPVLMFLESVITLDGAIAQLATERLDGQPVLFRDCSVKLEEQLQMAEELSEQFNLLARTVGAAEINLEELRNSLQSETDRQISSWLHLARIAALSTFGTEKGMDAAMEQSFPLFQIELR
jgi:hypothetical protein